MDSFQLGTEDGGILLDFRRQGQDCIKFRSACVSQNKCIIIPSPRNPTTKTAGSRSVVFPLGTEIIPAKSKKEESYVRPPLLPRRK